MNAITITSKGQITLRKELLAHLGVRPGDKISLEKLPDGRVAIRPDKKTGKIDAFCGFLKREGQEPISIEEMNEVIERGWAGEL
ncbi:AbrB family looped-hinge helix DNA binding protein [Sphingomonas sp. BE270]|jgi:antitoxin PrlF|uniref:AbrB/MazE/SpoVT family DNA-binding domain-containing protein n=1 Tax=Sphingomonas sp. BE270 TaxID=2817726 RepID=UPI002854E58D|nr:AbrB/MazE/SpoVT family DNA-binding domain-containing protein [Sphingomonas sp. BE270]MDR7256314.1 AbrB family looped-hinge helix DNA binding protein [Sphingomonas sp. BE270]